MMIAPILPQPLATPILRRQTEQLAKDEKSTFWPAALLRSLSDTIIAVTNHDRSPVKAQKPYDANCAIRPTALGKKNWLFIGEAEAGERRAILYTLVESCRRRGSILMSICTMS
jgi:hypothetical protein